MRDYWDKKTNSKTKKQKNKKNEKKSNLNDQKEGRKASIS